MTRPIGYRGRQVLGLATEALLQGTRAPSYADMAEVLGMDVTSVGRVVRRLERRGLLRRADTGARYRRGWRTPVIEMRERPTM